MEQKPGVQINKKTFLQSLIILLLLMITAGIFTLIIPPGQYDRQLMGDREIIDASSYHKIDQPYYPIWRWFTAPVEVLSSPDGLTVIVIILFLVMVGGSFAILDTCGIMIDGINRIILIFGGRKYLLLFIVSFFFMALGAFFGIFEEVVPLIPIMLALSYSLGWDSLVGLGMSVLATNMGFSAALTNPFTIGIAQKIAGLPLFSGVLFRVPIFLVVYGTLMLFLVKYAKTIDRHPEKSLVHDDDIAAKLDYQSNSSFGNPEGSPSVINAGKVFLLFLLVILITMMSGPVIPAISDYILPIVGILFLIGGIFAGKVSGASWNRVLSSLGKGIMGIAPGIVLILMAVSVKHIVVSGEVLDTLLYQTSNWLTNAPPFLAAVFMFFLALIIEFFIGSGSAKAFLMMPILVPLADLVDVTRQVAVTAYCFGDGFSNMVYPTNPVLLIALGLTVVSYTKWIRWTAKLWLWIILVAIIFLGIGVSINYGPF